MLKELTIFEAAANYDFSAIRAYVEGGSSLNICNDKGHSLLACFIDGYYDHEDEDPEELALYDIHDESDYDFWDSYVLATFALAHLFFFHILELERVSPRNHRSFVEFLEVFLV